MIQNLIISGGGYHIFKIYGMLNKLQKKNIFNMNDIKSIHGVSAGSIIGTILCLKMNNDELLNYYINRPWEKDIKIEPENFLNLFHKNGILDNNFFEIILNKLLLSKNLKKDINLLEFYKYSNIELYIYSLSINTIKYTSFSYKTHPNLKLIDAIYMSSTLPFIFQPKFLNNSYMLDGGLLNHFPYFLCKEKEEEILGVLIKKKYIDIENNSSLIKLYTGFFNNLLIFHNLKNYEKIKKKKNIFIYNVDFFDKDLLVNLINKKKTREEEIKKGENLIDNYFD